MTRAKHDADGLRIMDEQNYLSTKARYLGSRCSATVPLLMDTFAHAFVQKQDALTPFWVL
jgi:hypothetical protein